MNDILFEVLKSTIIIVIILITRYLVPYLKMEVQTSKYAELVDWVEKAVKDAEQTITESGKGDLKKQKVADFIIKYAIDKGVNITYEQVSVLIEAAVKTMKDGE